QLRGDIANYPIDFHPSKQFLVWQKKSKEFFQNCDATLQDLDLDHGLIKKTHDSLYEQLNQIEAGNDSTSYHTKLEQADQLLASISKVELNHVRIQHKIKKASFELKCINESLEKYKQFSNSDHTKLQTLRYPQLQYLKKLSERMITEARGNNNHL